MRVWDGAETGLKRTKRDQVDMLRIDDLSMWWTKREGERSS